MSPPYRKSEFEIVYGQGIQKFTELIDLGSQYDVLKKWGKIITFQEVKYPWDDFENLLNDNPEMEEAIKNEIIKQIKNENLNIEKIEDDGI